MRALLVALAVAGPTWMAGCAGLQNYTMTPEREAAAAPAVEALRAAAFDEAAKQAGDVLARDTHNAQAHLVAAVCRYHDVMHDFYRDMTSFVGGLAVGRTINHRLLKDAFGRAEAGLAGVERHLAAASAAPDIRLALCLACWERDWNHNGRVDDRDRLLFQIELDANGERIPDDDPRRKPTFHFDRGDVFWARAMVAFQRAVFDLVLAYRLPEMNELQGFNRGRAILTIKMVDRARVHQARDRILAGIAHADRARQEYLAETDDQGEWVPNPDQKDHPLPLPVDATLYQTWEGVLHDLRALLRGEEGISVAEVAQLGDHQWQDPPGGFVNLQKMFEAPGDLVFRFDHFEALDGEPRRQEVERVIEDILGDKYVTGMKPSPLLSRLARMKHEMQRGEESLERKLRYLIWLN